VPRSVFENFKEAIRTDRPAFQKAFLDDFFNVDKLRGTRISDEAWQAHFIVAVSACGGAPAMRDFCRTGPNGQFVLPARRIT
jgi:hypothetical protein